MFSFSKKSLACVVGIQVLVLAGAAQAAEIEEVLVTSTPIRDSSMAAIQAKRNALNYMDAISADNIGRFPDQNLADSLGRLPGLAIERDQGQARYINLRGAPFRYTTIAFDGINVPGAESGRVPRFDSFPSVITSRVEANKAILPSMPGETVAGYINIRTYSPFDKKGFGMATDIGGGRQNLGGGDVSKYSARGSWSDESFGAMLYGSQNSRDQITDNREYALERDTNGALITHSLEYRSYKVERSDKAWGGNLEYRGDNVLQSLSLRTLYSEFLDQEERNQFVFDFATPLEGLTGTGARAAVSRLLEDGDYKNSTQTSTLAAKLALGQWQVDAAYNTTKTKFNMDLPIPRSVSGTAFADYNLSDIENPRLSLDRPLASVSYPATIGIHYVQALEVQTDKFKLDAERDINWFDQPAVLAMGAQFDLRDGNGFIATPGVGAFPASVDLARFDTGSAWDSKSTNTIGASYYDNVGVREAWLATGTLTAPVISAANMVAIQEDVQAFYGMVTTDFAWGNLVLGARYERTHYISSGTSVEGPIEVDDTFGNFLPSAHLNVDLADDLKWRVSASSGLSRPTYDEWRAAATVDVTNKQVRGGNPLLEAEKSRGMDTSLEWYFAPASILSAGAFYRTIDNVIYADSNTIDPGAYLPSATGEQWTYTGSVNGSDGRMQGLELNFTGSAADWFSAPFDGLGLSANVTLLNTGFKGIDGKKYDLPGTSDMIYNSSVYYEKFGFSVRVNYQYRDAWISPIEDPSEVWGAQQRVDLSASYTLPMDLNGATASVYVNANNLTDEVDLRFDGNGTVNQRESYGRYWLMGFRINY